MSKIPISLNEDFEQEFQNFKRNHNYSYIKLSGLQPKQLDAAGYIRDFCEANNQADNSIDGTSNSTSKDIVALENDISKPMFKMVALNKIFTKLAEKYGSDVANNWLDSELSGKSYLHDAHSATFIPYCYAYDLTKLATEGLFFLSHNGGIPYNNQPAKHLDTFVNHIKEYVSFCCNRQAGAVGLPNIVPYLYYFWIKDIEQGYNGCHWLNNKHTGIETFCKYDNSNPNIKYFKQCVQSLIYALNQPYLRNSIQSAFTNFSIFDHYYAHALFDGVIFPDGSLAYDHIDNIVNLQVVVMQVISDIRHINMFTFPVLTFCLLKEKGEGESTKFKDEEFAKWASDHNTQWFDSNFYISDTIDSLSNCCRLSSSIKDMMNDQGYFNSLGSSGLSVGSIKVNTINTANLAYQTITETKLDSSSGDIIKSYFTNAEKLYIQKLRKQARLNMMVLDVIRDIIIANKEKRHLLPNIADGLIDIKHMYNTIGIIGVYETLKAFQNKLNELKNVLNLAVNKYDYIRYDNFDNTYYTTNAETFAKNLFSALHNEIEAFRKEYKCNYSINVEQVPAETAAYKLMQKDELSYPDLVIKDLPLYGNQFIPLGIKTTLEERVRIAALFDTFLNGGSIAHLNFESTLNKEQAWKYLNWIAQQGLTYSALNTKISACRHNHGFFGSICPICGEKAVTMYSRIVGFYVSSGITPEGKETAYGSWSTIRKEEFKLRQWEQDK